MVTLVRSDGVVACTYSTERDGVDLGTLAADGTIELELPPLKLIAEMYSVNVTVRQKGFQDIVCMQVGTTFHVRDELLSHHFGVFNEPGTWRGDAVPEEAVAVDARRRMTVVGA
jgi:lipopolysaccharide transport system ATP-binding protein